MRKLVFFSCFAMLSTCFAQSSLVTQEVSYFYLDATCTNCLLDQEDNADAYYVVSDSIYTGKLDESRKAAYIAEFKSKITRSFDMPQLLVKNVVIRNLHVKSEIKRYRAASIAKHKRRNYIIASI